MALPVDVPGEGRGGEGKVGGGLGVGFPFPSCVWSLDGRGRRVSGPGRPHPHRGARSGQDRTPGCGSCALSISEGCVCLAWLASGGEGVSAVLRPLGFPFVFCFFCLSCFLDSLTLPFCPGAFSFSHFSLSLSLPSPLRARLLVAQPRRPLGPPPQSWPNPDPGGQPPTCLAHLARGGCVAGHLDGPPQAATAGQPTAAWPPLAPRPLPQHLPAASARRKGTGLFCLGWRGGPPWPWQAPPLR